MEGKAIMKRAGELLSPYLRRCTNGHRGPAYGWEGSGRYLCRRRLAVADEEQRLAYERLERQAAALEKERLDKNNNYRKQRCCALRERKREGYQRDGFTLHDIEGADDGRFVLAPPDSRKRGSGRRIEQ